MKTAKPNRLRHSLTEESFYCRAWVSTILPRILFPNIRCCLARFTNRHAKMPLAGANTLLLCCEIKERDIASVFFVFNSLSRSFGTWRRPIPWEAGGERSGSLLDPFAGRGRRPQRKAPPIGSTPSLSVRPNIVWRNERAMPWLGLH